MSDEKLYLMGCCAIFVPNFGRNVRQVYESVQGFITLNTKAAQSLEMQKLPQQTSQRSWKLASSALKQIGKIKFSAMNFPVSKAAIFPLAWQQLSLQYFSCHSFLKQAISITAVIIATSVKF